MIQVTKNDGGRPHRIYYSFGFMRTTKNTFYDKENELENFIIDEPCLLSREYYFNSNDTRLSDKQMKLIEQAIYDIVGRKETDTDFEQKEIINLC